jgi:hypothetical protein
MDYSQSHVVTFVEYLNILKKKQLQRKSKKEGKRKGKTSD